jgi:cytochrome b pre-mRNA-processing protein 3
MLKLWSARRTQRQQAQSLLGGIVDAARRPVLYRDLGVADTVDGRFDLLVLHAWLVLRRLRAQKDAGLSQALVDTLFVHLDESLREQGAGDVGMSRRMKKMAQAFYGRCEAYDAAETQDALAEALLRNIYRGDRDRIEHAAGLAIYVERAREALERCDLATEPPSFGERISDRHDRSSADQNL